MDTLARINRMINKVMIFAAGLFLIIMIALTCSNIFLRALWTPIPGAYELMGYFGAVVATFSLGFTQMRKGHIAVDVLVSSFPGTLQKALTGINHLICLVFFIIVSWQTVLKANVLRESGEVTETLRIIYYPFTYAVSIGCAVLAFVFLTELVLIIANKKPEESP